ncbi:MAG TPA: PAS domain-containing sensor histidine kinase [Acetobacteraceae bacterium]|nr:PAS domain-containing sensor histidine kinase [Acetobacteraceae bacterium]
MFGAFIVACGVTHAMEMWTLWYPVYWYAGVAKAFTAAVSLGTAWLLYRLTPVALALPSARDLRAANAALNHEVEARRAAERELAAAKAEVEQLLRLVQEEARRTSAVLDRFFDEAPLGLALLDGELTFVRVNPALARIGGRPMEQYTGVRLDQLPQAPAEVVEAVQEVVRLRLPRLDVEVNRQGADGVPRSLRCSFFSIGHDQEERLVGAAVQDVTEQRQLERQRTEAIESLQDAHRRKDDFIAALAHELRNPLAPVNTAAEILARAGLGDKPGRMVAVIQRQVRHMARLIDDLLDAARIARGKLEIRSVPCDLAEVAAEVVEDLRPTLEGAGTVVTLHRGGALRIEGDRVRLAQAIGNYVSNAAKFAPAGPVRVDCFADAAAGEAVVSVTDQGPGIDAALLPQLFTPFLQGRQDMARTQGGLGLGLSITRGIAELHGGRVLARSEGRDRGATFEIRIPLRPREP